MLFLSTVLYPEYTMIVAIPLVQMVGDKQYSITADYLSTPVEAYDEAGKKVWFRELDYYGQVRKGL